MFRVRAFCLIGMVLILSNCSLINAKKKKQESLNEIVKEVQMINDRLPDMEPMIIRVVGYGAINPKMTNMSNIQTKLLAMRASKLDAFRSMAERVYGTQIYGTSTVENLVIKNDQFRTYVDTYILGARVIAQEDMADGSFQTILEMVLDQGFRNCITSEQHWKKNARCASEMVHDVNVLNRQNLREQGVNTKDSGLYFIE
ncbi:MAG: LPP20 family lipoprotein [Saccharospirillaceae bacterium]|nr:LPP20 family lipoprotein [Pseudomonadales bacterium]NRB79770.1 LPP20 family lipoprotein [Saccharospirillaceae bacterium]